MALFEKKKGVWAYDISHEGDDTVLRVDCEDYIKLPSLEDDPLTMAKTCEFLVENTNVTKIVFSQKRDYEYDYSQTIMISEIAALYSRLIKQKELFNYTSIGGNFTRRYNQKYAQIQDIISNLLKSDPIGAYVELKRIMRNQQIELQKLVDLQQRSDLEKYISLLAYLIRLLEKTKLIVISQPHLAGFRIGDRSIYRRVLTPSIKPDFMFTKLMSTYPSEGEELDSYTVGETEVTIFSIPNSVQYLYHVLPPEFKLSEEKYELLDLARKILSEHKPKRAEFVDPQRMRQVFFNVGKDLLEELADQKKLRLRSKEITELTNILVRYTVGFGLVEILLQDEKVQDISINAPMGQIPMFIVHQDFDDCRTNILPVGSEADSWASKLRMISGRPLDEADPILDTELELSYVRSRVAVITKPLNPYGLGFSFRRHRDKPWTLPLFINVNMVNPLAAGLLSFLIDGTRTMLIAGTRSSGKSSLLSSLLVEIMRRYRIITVEDTLELPTNHLKNLGYNIQPMKVASALSHGSTEVDASDGIRSTLRLGDSALIVGEVRSKEAIALYEAMRVGAAANVVAGTIHGDSPYGVFDRVVNDIGIPKTSFKATDIIVVANPIKSPDGIHKMRRVTQITEVRKKWTDDPMLEGGFIDLMKYNVKTDTLEPTQDLIEGESEILKTIAGNIKNYAGNWDAMWDNIQLRAKIKDTLAKTAIKIKDNDILEAQFVVKANDTFHNITDKVNKETGNLDSKRIFTEWNDWLKRALKKRKTKQ